MMSTILIKGLFCLAYALAVLEVLTRATLFAARITEKGAATEVETYQIGVGNGRHYGGGNIVEETAEIDDGHLDLYSLEMTNLWKLAPLYWRCPLEK